MFDWPMSSPQMTRMFGFLPSWAARAATAVLWAATVARAAGWAPASQHDRTGAAIAGPVGAVRSTAAVAGCVRSRRPAATAHPSTAPTATRAIEARCERFIMTHPLTDVERWAVGRG